MSQPIAPDVGMAQLAQNYARQAAGAAPGDAGDKAADDTGGGGAELDIFARLSVSLDSAAAEMRKNRNAAKIPWEYCHPIPLNPINVPAGGVVSDERWEPREGFAWHVVRMSVVSTGATTVSAFRDTTAANAWMVNSFTGTANAFLGLWEPKGEFLLAGNRLIFSAVAGTATVNGQAIEVAIDWLPTYLL